MTESRLVQAQKKAVGLLLWLRDYFDARVIDGNTRTNNRKVRQQMTESRLQQHFPNFRISVQRGENGRQTIRILTDDDEADRTLESMGLESRYNPTVDADVYTPTASQALDFLRRMLGDEAEAITKPKLSEKQRQARAENAKRATLARLAKQPS